MKISDYYGRLLTVDTLPEELAKDAVAIPALEKKKGRWYCQRCQTKIESIWMLPTQQVYCRACLLFGRICQEDKLYYIPQAPFSKKDVLNWQGQLTPYQATISQYLLEAYNNRQDSLVHAVTGAGKTEMIYHLVNQVIAEGKQVALVSPRIDVCMELYKRLSKDFSCPISLLHGESDPYHRSPLVIATVHQLYKFYEAFELIIIDEVDAFPLVDNPFLYQAIENALSKEGVKIFLTATSTKALEKAVNQGNLVKYHLARRFHGNPLVVPRCVFLDSLLKQLEKGKLPKKLIAYIRLQRQTGYPLLLFFPHIALGEKFSHVLQTYFPKEKISFVSSQSPNRLQEVEAFRTREVGILVSTTILERGVTFPCVDVGVLWANHHLFTQSSLVQISGRVGRSQERPTGDLIFFHDGQTRAMKGAIREIREMNRLGGFV